MSVDDDWTLVARAQQGDLDAFAALVRKYEQPVRHFCLRMLGSVPDAEEIAQDAFVRVYRHLSKLRPQAKFSTLLFGIARNLSLNALRDTRRRAPAGRVSEIWPNLADPNARPDQEARLREMEAAVEKGLRKLTPEHREALVLRELQGMDYETIASVTRSRVGTVKSRIARAREQLRLVLRAEFGEL